jgi:hypothetical protein
MGTVYHIRYLAHRDIDKDKWDACVETAPNQLVYGHSFYLDTLAGKWHALVLNDYEAVMPLPRRRKAGFSYLFQPPMTPILGIFGRNITAQLVAQFLQAIPTSFRLWDISLNHFNPLASAIHLPVFTRNNFILSLHKPYEQVQAQYHPNIKRNAAKALKKECSVQKDGSIEDVIAICQKQFPAFTRVERGLFKKLKTIYLHYTGQGKIYCVRNKEGIILAAAAFLFSGGRVYYWLVGNIPESREYGASSLLLDTFISDHAYQPLILDFEGSDDKGVAAFYKKFGALAEPFSTIYHNRLPFPLRLLKPLPPHYRDLVS